MRNLNDVPNIKEIDQHTVERGDEIFHEDIHTVVFVIRVDGHGVGMGADPGETYVVCNSGLVICYDDFDHRPQIIGEALNDDG